MEKSFKDLKAAAIAEVDKNNPMCAYHTHLKGREDEYSYAEFLEDIEHPNSVKKQKEAAKKRVKDQNAAAKKVAAETQKKQKEAAKESPKSSPTPDAKPTED